ncbi:MAG: HAD-IA family hydrolase [Chloroflexi bacterium]|nr:HAD-IA family hydrolase [Chloroflexota bacterium]MDA1228318.1 HAD-IA family hydrolase [Chloroflexota bacterium]
MIRAVFFDLYNTLAGFRPSRHEIQSEALAEFDIQVTPEGIIRGYHLADGFMSAQNATKPMRGLSKSERDAFFAEYERLVLSGAGVEVTPTLAGEIWTRIRKVDYSLAAFDDSVPVLQQLRNQGLVVGLISNMHQDGDELAESLGLLAHLDFTVTSMEVGAEKPKPPIFHRALEKANASPAEAVHVGDQLTSDVDGAVGVGISPVLLDRDGNHPGYEEHPRIENLSQLPQLLSDLS